MYMDMQRNEQENKKIRPKVTHLNNENNEK